MTQPDQLAREVLEGQVRAAARLMRGLDDGLPWALEALKLLHPHTGQAQVIGLTGSPGVGKSTLIDALLAALRARDIRVGVVAVDPSSPYGGGSIMGDRVRMQRHAADPGVFIRSMATRGHLGGLNAATNRVVKVMDAMGFAMVLVETVGVGQVELEVAGLADTTVVVTVPGLGDEVQAIKAGILEVADILAVNKADRPGADGAIQALAAMLEFASPKQAHQGWRTALLSTCATKNQGIDELVAALREHWEFLNQYGGSRLRVRRGLRVRQEMLELIKDDLTQTILGRLEQGGRLQDMVERVQAGQADPYSLSQDLVKKWLSPSGDGPEE